MANREETLREVEGYDHLARDLVKDLTGKDIMPTTAGDIMSLIPLESDHPPPRKTLRTSKAAMRAQRKAIKKKHKANKLKEEEEKFSALMIRLKAGDPNHTGYEARLAGAKKSTRLREELPKAAQLKWANKDFQKKMEERGMTYNVSYWKGWLPYEEAKDLQQRLIGAKSRGEYEVYMKLFVIRFLPARPDRVYGEHWKGWNDFLGTVNVFGANRRSSVNPDEYRSFFEALTFARSLKLKTVKQWQAACRGGLVPIDIPIDPHNVYPNDFVDIEHWLGSVKAVDIVKGKQVVPEAWVLYTDGRDDACWWAKMSVDKYKDFKTIADVRVVRAYEFEPSISDKVWSIFDALSVVYEEDPRERMIGGNALHQIVESLDAILKWIV